MIRRPPMSTLFPSTTLFRAGQQVGDTFTASAWRSAGQSDTLTLNGDWAPGEHAVEVRFLNDKWDGTADRKSTRLNSSHANISYAVFCLKKKNHRPYCAILLR